MTAAVPVPVILCGLSSVASSWIHYQPQVCFVYQRGGLEGLPRFLLGQVGRSQLAQFVINQRQEFLGGVRVAFFNRRQDAGDFSHRRSRPERSGSIAASISATDADRQFPQE